MASQTWTLKRLVEYSDSESGFDVSPKPMRLVDYSDSNNDGPKILSKAKPILKYSDLFGKPMRLVDYSDSDEESEVASEPTSLTESSGSDDEPELSPKKLDQAQDCLRQFALTHSMLPEKYTLPRMVDHKLIPILSRSALLSTQGQKQEQLGQPQSSVTDALEAHMSKIKNSALFGWNTQTVREDLSRAISTGKLEFRNKTTKGPEVTPVDPKPDQHFAKHKKEERGKASTTQRGPNPVIANNSITSRPPRASPARLPVGPPLRQPPPVAPMQQATQSGKILATPTSQKSPAMRGPNEQRPKQKSRLPDQSKDLIKSTGKMQLDSWSNNLHSSEHQTLNSWRSHALEARSSLPMAPHVSQERKSTPTWPIKPADFDTLPNEIKEDIITRSVKYSLPTGEVFRVSPHDFRILPRGTRNARQPGAMITWPRWQGITIPVYYEFNLFEIDLSDFFKYKSTFSHWPELPQIEELMCNPLKHIRHVRITSRDRHDFTPIFKLLRSFWHRTAYSRGMIKIELDDRHACSTIDSDAYAEIIAPEEIQEMLREEEGLNMAPGGQITIIGDNMRAARISAERLVTQIRDAFKWTPMPPRPPRKTGSEVPLPYFSGGTGQASW